MVPSVNSGICALPLASEDVVVVVVVALIAVAADPVMFSVPLPELLNTRPGPSCALSCASTFELMPPDRLTPTIFGLAFGRFCNGNALGSVTLTIVICCCAAVPVLVTVRLMVLPGCMLEVLTLKPAGDPESAAPGETVVAEVYGQ